MGRQSLQTSPRVSDGISGHHLGKVRKGVGTRTGGGCLARSRVLGNERRSKDENFGIGSSGGDGREPYCSVDRFVLGERL